MRLDDVVDRLASVPGVAAVVLGGSRARGLAMAGSDTDLGLYYRDKNPIDLDRLRDAVHDLDRSRPEVTDLYAWGPWVNGGAWTNVDGVGDVDLVYRSVDHVARTIDALTQGVREHHWNQQPPFGFTSVIYAGEVHGCHALRDDAGVVESLKERVATYPAALRRAIVAEDLALAEFTLRVARKPAFRSDVRTTMGCLTRADHYLVQTLFAVNRTWFVSDKTATVEIAGFDRRPSDYAHTMGSALAGAMGTIERVELMVELLAEVVSLAGELYTPRW